LQQWIIARPAAQASERANPRNVMTMPSPTDNADGRFTCEICHTDYRIRVHYEFQCSRDRCLGFNSLGHVFEMFLLLIMIGICGAMLPIMNKRIDKEEEDKQHLFSEQADKILFPVIVTLLVS